MKLIAVDNIKQGVTPGHDSISNTLNFYAAIIDNRKARITTNQSASFIELNKILETASHMKLTNHGKFENHTKNL